ncbi:MAG: SGNH/GDSL hydrolase family protein [Acidobacteriaceae bacterium]
MNISLLGLALAVPSCSAANAPGNAVANSPWVATWAAAMVATKPADVLDFSGQTLREVVHTSVGGLQTRVWFSNRFGIEPLVIGSAHVALSAGGSALQAGSDHALTFHHMTSITIPPGATMVSDPVAFQTPAASNLAISLYLPGHVMATTEHSAAKQISYTAAGNAVDALSLPNTARQVTSWYFLTGVDVYAPGDSAVVTFGDSITDGAHSTLNKNHRWPDFLATRLAADPKTRQAGVLGVANGGIGGNSVLVDSYGPNSVARVDRDILARSGARYVIVLESVNDIAGYTRHHLPYGDLEQRLEVGLSEIAAQARLHNLLVFGATLTPYQGSRHYSPEGEAVREKLNQWIRTTHVFDGVIDFDQATHNPNNPQQYLPKYDAGDHIHPNDAGYNAMAQAINLDMFLKTSPKGSASVKP